MTQDRAGKPSFASPSFRLCIFFALNPDEYLTSSDVAQKYGMTSNAVEPTLKSVVASGYVARTRSDLSKRYIYSAGPALMEML